MNRAILIGGAVSGLVLACAAYAANTSYNLAVQGQISGFCNITAADVGGDYSLPGPHSLTGATFSFPSTQFGDSLGHGLAVDGHTSLTVHSNTTCTYSVTSAKGALFTASGAKRDYRAALYQQDDTPSYTNLNSSSADKPIGTPLSLPNVGHVIIDFQVDKDLNTVLAAGEYSDTLKLVINPH